jgi:hypothetical protein
MLITANYQLTPEELARALKQISGKRRLMGFWAFTAALLLAGVFCLATGRILFGIACVAWGVVFAMGLTRGVKKNAEKTAERLCKPTEVTFSEEIFTYRSPTSNEEHRWQGFIKTEETAEFFLLYVSERRAIPVPKRALDAADVAQTGAFLHRAPMAGSAGNR